MGEKGYKAFSKGMICRGKQYEENTTYKESGSEICEAGVMHYCENPFDVLNYYPLVDDNGDMTEFAEVEAQGNVYKKDDKSATNKLHIGAKLSFKGFIKACIDFTLEKTKMESSESGVESDYGNNRAQLASSGYRARLSSSGDEAQLASSGDRARLASSGDGARLASSGDRARLASSGDGARLASSGDGAQLASSGDRARLASSGDGAQLASSGDRARLASSGKNSVVMAAGYQSQAKAKKGSWITLTEWAGTDDKDEKGFYIWIPKCVKTEYVDGERIKEDTFYMLVDGEFKEVQ